MVSGWCLQPGSVTQASSNDEVFLLKLRDRSALLFFFLRLCFVLFSNKCFKISEIPREIWWKETQDGIRKKHKWNPESSVMGD